MKKFEKLEQNNTAIENIFAVHSADFALNSANQYSANIFET